MTRDGWTIAEASADFATTGRPIPPRQLAMVIRALPGFKAIGETPSGGRGGRGQLLYDIAEFQLLHRNLSRWLAASPDAVSNPPDVPARPVG